MSADDEMNRLIRQSLSSERKTKLAQRLGLQPAPEDTDQDGDSDDAAA
jgi:plasmid replication initiation protein